DPHRLDLVLLEQDVVPFRDLVALDDVVAVDRAEALHDFLVLDRLAARFVDLAEGYRSAALGRGVDFYGYRDQRQPDLPLPIGACRHRSCPLSRRFSAWRRDSFPGTRKGRRLRGDDALVLAGGTAVYWSSSPVIAVYCVAASRFRAMASSGEGTRPIFASGPSLPQLSVHSAMNSF